MLDYSLYRFLSTTLKKDSELEKHPVSRLRRSYLRNDSSIGNEWAKTWLGYGLDKIIVKMERCLQSRTTIV